MFASLLPSLYKGKSTWKYIKRKYNYEIQFVETYDQEKLF